MPARNGSQYLERLRVHPKNLWIEGEKVEDVTGHRAFSGCADSIASLYEMQHDVDLSSKMTFNPGSGDKPEGLSFITPTSKEHLVQRGSMMLRWARFSGGVMARTPDYMNVILMACSAASDFFGKDDKAFGQNIKNYFRYVMENDLTLTHTLVNVRKTKKYPSYAKGDDLGLHLTRERDDGIIVKGARILATLAPLSDEIL
ncbi:MAG TPA: 4-hydroxyphenylacetate 3-monooxygenase, oxygenase component, partial [Dehalococcoidia bacterium]|nr:4-hydroxyphenylacetate 3-monooxygenase, oxygenase component [Dehalococcoidia bacterium]